MGTDILFHSVTTVKLVHYWAFRAIVSFAVSATPWGRFIISVSQRLKPKLQEDKKLVQITQLINTKAEFEAQPT